MSNPLYSLENSYSEPLDNFYSGDLTQEAVDFYASTGFAEFDFADNIVVAESALPVLYVPEGFSTGEFLLTAASATDYVAPVVETLAAEAIVGSAALAASFGLAAVGLIGFGAYELYEWLHKGTPADLNLPSRLLQGSPLAGPSKDESAAFVEPRFLLQPTRRRRRR